MTATKSMLAALDAQSDRQRFMALPIETRLRNTCPGCGCRFTDDFTRAIELVTAPPRKGKCRKCGWVGTNEAQKDSEE